MNCYAALLERIEGALARARRRREEVTLVAVTKNHSPEEILSLYQEGVRDFGENRLQEFLPKKSVLPQDIRWHFIGTLQKNKVGKVVGEVVLIHSVDSLELAKQISDVSVKRGVSSSILLQVNIAKEKAKHGLEEKEWEAAFPLLKALPAIAVKGLMAMAPLTEDAEVIRETFKSLRLFRDHLEKKFQIALPELSMGMSQDFEIAIEEGATLLRIGTLLFEK